MTSGRSRIDPDLTKENGFSPSEEDRLLDRSNLLQAESRVSWLV